MAPTALVAASTPAPGPIGEESGLAPVSNLHTFPFRPTTIVIPAHALARITARGFITLTPNGAYEICAKAPAPPLPGGLYTVGPTGYPGGQLALAVGLGTLQGAGPTAPLTWRPVNPGAEETRTYVSPGLADRPVWVARPAGFPYGCNELGNNPAPAYLVNGD